MTMSFPGMDPYLGNPAVFPGIHTRMVVYMADQIAPLVHPRYIASTGERIDYQAPCEPPLERDEQTWADELIQASAG